MDDLVATYRTWLDCGLSRRRLRTAVLHRRWVRERRGIYVPACVPPFRRALLSAQRGLGRGWVASHGTAAGVHGLFLLTPPDPQLLVVTVPAGTAGHSDPVATHVHRAGLPESHVVVVDGVPMTTVARTLIDLARALPVREGLVAIDAALHRQQVSLTDLRAVAAQCARWPGVRRARRLVELADPRCESPLESVSRLFFVDFDISMPESQFVLTQEGRFVARLDFWWRLRRVAGEADGLAKYTSPEILRAEKLRQEDIEQCAATVVRWTWPDVTVRATAVRTAQRLRRALGGG